MNFKSLNQMISYISIAEHYYSYNVHSRHAHYSWTERVT